MYWIIVVVLRVALSCLMFWQIGCISLENTLVNREGNGWIFGENEELVRWTVFSLILFLESNGTKLSSLYHIDLEWHVEDHVMVWFCIVLRTYRTAVMCLISDSLTWFALEIWDVMYLKLKNVSSIISITYQPVNASLQSWIIKRQKVQEIV